MTNIGPSASLLADKESSELMVAAGFCVDTSF